jgi:hypothetical protein
MSSRERPEPTSSSAVIRNSTPERSGKVRKPVDRLDQSTEHVEDAGPGHLAVGHREQPLREGSEREDGVVVPEEQDPRLAATRPHDMRAGTPIDHREGARQVPL